MNGWLTVSVSLRWRRRTVPRPLSSRTMPAIAFRLTMVERWICLKVFGSSRGEQFAQRGAQQRLAVGGDHRGVFLVGLEIGDVVDQDQPGLAAGAGGEPGQRFRRAGLRADAPSLPSRAASAAASGCRSRACRRATVASRRSGFTGERVVDRAALEGIDRVLVVGGHEHDLVRGLASAATAATSSPVRPGMRMSRKATSGCSFSQRCLHRAGAVLAFGDDLQGRPRALEFGDQRDGAAAIRPRRRCRCGRGQPWAALGTGPARHGDGGGHAGGKLATTDRLAAPA